MKCASGTGVRRMRFERFLRACVARICHAHFMRPRAPRQRHSHLIPVHSAAGAGGPRLSRKHTPPSHPPSPVCSVQPKGPMHRGRAPSPPPTAEDLRDHHARFCATCASRVGRGSSQGRSAWGEVLGGHHHHSPPRSGGPESSSSSSAALLLTRLENLERAVAGLVGEAATQQARADALEAALGRAVGEASEAKAEVRALRTRLDEVGRRADAAAAAAADVARRESRLEASGVGEDPFGGLLTPQALAALAQETKMMRGLAAAAAAASSPSPPPTSVGGGRGPGFPSPAAKQGQGGRGAGATGLYSSIGRSGGRR